MAYAITKLQDEKPKQPKQDEKNKQEVKSDKSH